MKNFALIGAAGFIAVRHMKAIKETKNNLISALDKFDSVGIIDSYFPDADFFTEYERFDRHIDKLRRTGKKVDYVSICTPNYLHDSHIRFALKQNADAICEKPLVLNPWNIDALQEIEKETGKDIYNILQLRLHHSIIKLKEEIDKGPKDKIYDIDLTYITSRGHWYHNSWKGEDQKSGGIATNIGVHFFDMLSWIFGKVQRNKVHFANGKRVAGLLHLEKANVRWLLSLEYEDVPAEVKKAGQRTFRTITVENKEIEFSGGFTDLHTRSYEEILKGKGFGLQEARPSIETVFDIRHAKPIGLRGDYHPFLNKIKNK
ncbi:MAG: Gfo/Idh/MocA family oxidoreductase [Bacteroidetes bacterium]|jgi:UDP-N-acetyl-2-amino-2-deoxyglucuronate dehydrogenase|nr:Gfo/Idh/MocA family oxidoreductase [Bacteroidota bacterium]MBT6687150.1 Gfo/Idh/MocA family oxidoreductase [Bacteroidota bacterium]MBT7144923.1 Gfo/Idh/MocA family oxidoreductase [Bacteroidota bacterium]MBT7492158.1 Gfo/Idh/MocA family oxidoreductase [Bacteroidota bacterium]